MKRISWITTLLVALTAFAHSESLPLVDSAMLRSGTYAGTAQGWTDELELKNANDSGDYCRFAMIKADVSTVTGTVDSATFTVYATNSAACTLYIYGVNDSAPFQTWTGGSSGDASWNSVAANGLFSPKTDLYSIGDSNLVLLGSQVLPGSGSDVQVSVSGASLVDLLNNDTDGLLTFAFSIAENELLRIRPHTHANAPTLSFTYPPPVELGQVSKGLTFYPRRMNGKLPILDETWSLAQGAGDVDADNLNGPSCIRLPDWLPPGSRADPSAVYYLYFADHGGDYIRMAWAANLEGPWTGFRMDETQFPSLGDRGVLSLGVDQEIDLGEGITLKKHIASPQVFVDDINQRFVMYYHAPLYYSGVQDGQNTIVATSSDGLNFNMPASGSYSSDSRAGQTGHGTLPVSYGRSYFKVFEQAGRHYAFANTGDIYAAPATGDILIPPASYDHASDYWSVVNPSLFNEEMGSRGWPGAYYPRHFGVLKRDGILYAFHTNRDAAPERVQVSTFDFDNLPVDAASWKMVFPSQEVIRPEETWEGAQLPLDISLTGSSEEPSHQLRDPGILEDSDGRTYLFYSGAGEKGIGLTQIVTCPRISGETEVTTGEDHTYSVATDVDVTPAMLKISQAAPVEVNFDAEEAVSPFTYNGTGIYPVVQSATVGQGSQSYQLALFSTNASETLTFPDRYYARPGTTFTFSSRLGTSTSGQFAEVQVSFDGTSWQSIWQRVGGSAQSSFNTVSIDMEGLAGRTFDLRFRYIHYPVRNGDIESGAAAGTGWFIDEVVASGLEAVTDASEAAFTGSSFTLDDITRIIDSAAILGDDEDDRFLLCVSGLHSGTGFSEPTGYGKPYVIRARTSYEQFMYDQFSEAERADPLISGKMADTDKDGIINLFEHVAGTEPDETNGSMLSIAVVHSGGNTEPTVSFPWNAAAGYTYQLQMGSELDDFVDIPFIETSEIVNGKLIISLTPHPTVTLPSEKAFFRFKIQ